IPLASADHFGKRGTFGARGEIDERDFYGTISLRGLQSALELELCPLARIPPQKEWPDDLKDFTCGPFVRRARRVPDEPLACSHANQHRVPLDDGSFASPERHPERLRQRTGHQDTFDLSDSHGSKVRAC